MSYETADSQKEEFRKYLEKNGVISQLTRVLVHQINIILTRIVIHSASI